MSAATGLGSLTQSNGTNTIYTALYLGYNSGGDGTYSLSGAGQLTAPAEYIGYDSAPPALMQQTGGTNTTSLLSIGSGGQYQLDGGTLQVNGGLLNQGVFDGGNKPGSLAAQRASSI